MSTTWTLETHGDPLGTIRKFIRTVWSQANLEGLLAPVDGDAENLARPRLIDDPQGLENVNPFKPLMTLNAARLVPELVEGRPNARYGALLRPCEMRALVEMLKRDSFKIDNLLTISVDCLGTLPADEYRWRAERKKTPGGLSQEALQFARQGGISAYRFRSACQTCVSPEARGADLNLHVLGLPVRQQMLVEARDGAVAERFQLSIVAQGQAETALVAQHEKVLARMAERHHLTMERVTQSLTGVLPADIDALVKQLVGCGACQNCMDVCPICSVSYPRRNEDNLFLRGDVMRWLISCAGCGMCEQSCPNHLPLSTIFGHIRQQLDEEWDYVPGRSVEEPLPIL
jgi:formate dehydrogenase subunit beta